MNESHCKIQQILKAFERFIQICQSHSWVQNATTEDIKSAFKLGHFLENTLSSFKEDNCFSEFASLFQKWHAKQSRNNYNLDDFLTANDMLLKKIFQSEKVSDLTLDVGIRIYNSFYSKTRLKHCLKNMIIVTKLFIAIKEFVCDNVTSTKSIQSKIVLKSWSNCIVVGKNDAFKQEINSYLSLYKVESMLPILISILSIKDCAENEVVVQNIIMEELLEKMSDRSILTKKFWITLFTTVKSEDIFKVCCIHKPFLESLCNFIEYLGSMINIDNQKSFKQWKTDINVCICPEIGSLEIVNLLRSIDSKCSVKDYIRMRIVEAKEHGNLEFWEKLEKEIS